MSEQSELEHDALERLKAERRRLQQMFDDAGLSYLTPWDVCPLCGVHATAVNINKHEAWHLRNLQ